MTTAARVLELFAEAELSLAAGNIEGARDCGRVLSAIEKIFRAEPALAEAGVAPLRRIHRLMSNLKQHFADLGLDGNLDGTAAYTAFGCRASEPSPSSSCAIA